MKVAVFSYLPPTLSGIATHTLNLYNILSKKHDIHLITFRRHVKTNFKVHWIKTISNTIYIYDAITKLPKVIKLLKKIDPDIIHFHHNTSSIESGIYLIKAMTRARIVNTIHVSSGSMYEPFRGIYFSIIAKELNNLSDHIITVSEFNRKKLIEEGVNKRISVIYNGVNLNEFKQKPIEHNEPWIFFGGRHIIGKGLGTLIKAMKGINAKLIVTGNGPMTNYYKFNASENVKFVGKLKRKSYIRYLISSDIVVVPSIFNEANGIVAMEGMAAKKPVVVSNSGGLPEIVKKSKGGLIFKKGNYLDLKKKIKILLSDQSLRNKLGKKGYNWVKNWTWKKVARLTEKVYVSKIETK